MAYVKSLKNIKAVLFDVDGTLLDIRDGYCKGINDALGFYGFNKIDEDKIWKLRRNGMNAFKILQSVLGSHKKLPLVEKKRREFREALKYRNLDKPFKKAKWTLAKLKRNKKMIFITSLRESESFLIKQLGKFGLDKYVDDVFVIRENPSGKDHDLMKRTLIERLIRKHGFNPKECVIVGDAVADIRGGKQTGIFTVAVTWGVTGKKLLGEENPDNIINDISGIVKIAK